MVSFIETGFQLTVAIQMRRIATQLNVDVLRGPSSSLYGRGDPGGTFNLISKTPKSEQQTTLGAQLSSEGLYRTTVDTTGTVPDAENIGYRLNVIAEGGDSYRDHVESKRYGIAPVIQWQATDATKVTFEADILRNQHPLDRGHTRYPAQKSFNSSPETYLWETVNTTIDSTMITI